VKKFIRILGICYLVYLAIVLVIITPALNFLPAWAVEKYLGRELHSEFTYFNPFTLSLEVGKTELPEHDGERFVAFDQATINVSTASLWSGALVFDKMGIQQLYVHVKEFDDGTFNFTDMLPTEVPAAPQTEPAGIPAVTIELLDFNSQQLVYTNAAREKSSSTHLNDLTIKVQGLSTVLEEGKPYRLDATGEDGGQLHWEGVVSIPGEYSEGSVALTDIQLIPLWRFIEPWVAFTLEDGTLSIASQYKVNWSDTFQYQVAGGEFRLDQIDVKAKSSEALADTSVALGSLKLSGIELDSSLQHVDVESLDIGQLGISGWSEGEQVSLVDLFAVSFPQDATNSAAPADDSAAAEQAGWTASLGTFQLANSSLRWRSQYTDPAQLEVTPIEFTARAIKWPLEGDTDLKLALTINGQTSASAEGSLDLGSGVGSLAYQLQDLPLPWFNPNLPAALNGEITDGKLRLEGDIALAEFTPATIAMDGAVTGFAAKVSQAETSLTSWQTVRWEKLAIDMQKHRVELAKLSINNYVGRLHINEDGSINASKVWQAEVGKQAEDVKEELAEGEPWVVNMPLIQITDSEIDFMDESLPIHFRTVIGDLHGDIKNISTAPGVKTAVNIKGSVDGYAPVSLVGSAQPLHQPPAIDLELTFAGIDMALLSPYSGTYAGYAIERGVLNLDLNYVLEENRLKGKNKIVIEQMKLGEQVKSDKAVDLPLKLALALLTDSNGVIDMDIPISGNVNNPEFSVGSVVMGALVNLITKAVTSPFTLLANLVGSEQDLQRLNFKSGSAELRASAREKLDKLSTALAERPELNLVISGRLQVAADRERMQTNRLQAELVAAGLSEVEASSKGAAWEQAVVERYQALSPGETEQTVPEQYGKLAAEIPIADTDLLALASDRAIAVKTYLVNDAGLSPERAAISKSDLNAKTNLYSGVELAVDL
tara:strand:+ start:144747 stop:147566 length:2820 start_codon:yes stop_codon:yes gene_type:complete